MGLIALLGTWPRYLQSEFADYSFFNSWAALNLPDGYNPIYYRVRITLIIILLVATINCLWRLLPANWKLRNQPLRERFWPVLALSAPFVLAWFLSGVAPYRVPDPDAQRYPYTVVHVLRNGFDFEDTKISVREDGRFFVTRARRHPFQFRFQSDVATGWIDPQELMHLSRELEQLSPQQKEFHRITKPPLFGDSETWYVVLRPQKRAAMVAMPAAIPRDVLNWFSQVQTRPTDHAWCIAKKDICAGFCYNPAYPTDESSCRIIGKSRCSTRGFSGMHPTI